MAGQRIKEYNRVLTDTIRLLSQEAKLLETINKKLEEDPKSQDVKMQYKRY